MEFLNYPDLVIGQYKNFLSYDECQTIIENINKFTFMQSGAMAGDAESTWDRPIEENIEFYESVSNVLDIKAKIDSACTNYCTQNKIKNVHVVQMWANKQYKHSLLMPHHHGEKSTLSGVVYLKVDELSSGLKFIPMNKVVKPEIGMLIIFPSYVMHGSDRPNMSDERIILSFNTQK